MSLGINGSESRVNLSASRDSRNLDRFILAPIRAAAEESGDQQAAALTLAEVEVSAPFSALSLVRVKRI